MVEAEIREKRAGSSGKERLRSEVESVLFDNILRGESDLLSRQRRDTVSARQFDEAFKALSNALRSNIK